MFLTFADIHQMQTAVIKEVEVPTLGRIKVRVLTNEDIVKGQLYLKKLADEGDPAIQQKGLMAVVANAWCKEDGTRMFLTIEDGVEELLKMRYENFSLLLRACVFDINDINDERIYERAKKSVADQISASIAG